MAPSDHVRCLGGFKEMSPSWFVASMGTGGVALAIAHFPWDFTGRHELATAIWALNVVLYIFFCILLLGRAIIFPHSLGPLMRHPSEPLFFGATAMAFAVITNGFCKLFEHRFPADTLLFIASLLWLINLPATLLTSVALPCYLVTRRPSAPEFVTAVWLLAVVPANVAAGAAGTVAAAHAKAVAAAPVARQGLIGTVVFLGALLFAYALFLTLTIVTAYWHRLMVHRLPPAPQLISAFLPTGAIAMLGLGALNLGASSFWRYNTYSADPGLTELETFMRPAGLALGVLCYSYAAWWLILGIASAASSLAAVPFNLGWWSSVFPVATLALLGERIAVSFHFTALRAVAAGLTAAAAILWLLMSGLTLARTCHGGLFRGGGAKRRRKAAAAAAAAARAAAAAAAGDGDARAAAVAAAAFARQQSAELCIDPGMSAMACLHEAGRLQLSSEFGGNGRQRSEGSGFLAGGGCEDFDSSSAANGGGNSDEEWGSDAGGEGEGGGAAAAAAASGGSGSGSFSRAAAAAAGRRRGAAAAAAPAGGAPAGAFAGPAAQSSLEMV